MLLFVSQIRVNVNLKLVELIMVTFTLMEKLKLMNQLQVNHNREKEVLLMMMNNQSIKILLFVNKVMVVLPLSVILLNLVWPILMQEITKKLFIVMKPRVVKQQATMLTFQVMYLLMVKTVLKVKMKIWSIKISLIVMKVLAVVRLLDWPRERPTLKVEPWMRMKNSM